MKREAPPSQRPTAYRTRVLHTFRSLLDGRGPLPRALDFGAGDGWFAHHFQTHGLASEVIAVDVMPRRQPSFDVRLYDGRRLPFEDRSFDLVYSADVLHHCDSPQESLLDLLRCTDRYLLIKDHTYGSAAGRLALALMDEIGNRRFGVRSVYHYQRGWEWLSSIEAAGFELETLVHQREGETAGGAAVRVVLDEKIAVRTPQKVSRDSSGLSQWCSTSAL